MSVLTFDIETVRRFNNLEDADPETQKNWKIVSKSKHEGLDNEHGETYKQYAGIYPEFGKICCISWSLNGQSPESAYGDDEGTVLEEFLAQLPDLVTVVGHRIKQFDVPWINIAGVRYNMRVLHIFKMYGTKPWELDFVDTWEVWKNGNFSSVPVASLPTICNVLGIPTPKDDIDGSQVGEVYWTEGESGLERIKTYCEKDVDRTFKVYKKMIDLNMI